MISGSGNLNSTLNALVTFQGANTYTGATDFQALGTQNINVSGASTVTFNGSGTVLDTSSITSGSNITLDNSLTTGSSSNINGRLNPSAPITLIGSALAVIGNAAVGTTEAVNNVTNTDGLATITVTPNAATPASLTLASMTNLNSTTTLYRATGLGNAPGNGVGNIYLSAGADAGGWRRSGGERPTSASFQTRSAQSRRVRQEQTWSPTDPTACGH